MAGPIPLLGLLDELRDFANRRNIGQRMVGGGVRGAATRGLLGMDAPENATPIQREVYENAARAGAPVMGLAAAPAAIKTAGRALKDAPRAQALETARQNAVKMLGLPENNTAMDRARAMGFDTPAYRGTTADEVAGKARTFVSENPDVANQYAGYLSQFADDPKMLDAMMKLTPNGNVMPLLVRDAAKARARTNVPDYEMILDANQARSRFAAFDPARINENDLLASLAAMGISIPMILGLLDEERVD